MTTADEQWIRDTILAYDRRYPTGSDSIVEAVFDAKREQAELRLQGSIDKHGVVGKSQSGRRETFTMPTMLYHILKKQYPKLFTDDKEWFKRHFKMFVIN